MGEIDRKVFRKGKAAGGADEEGKIKTNWAQMQRRQEEAGGHIIDDTCLVAA